MKKNILRLFAMLFATLAIAHTPNNSAAVSYITKLLNRNPALYDVSVKTIYKKQFPHGWVGSVLRFNAKYKGKNITKEIRILSKGDLITNDIRNIKSNTSYASELYPNLSSKMYNKEHLILGKLSNKKTLVVFSDPRCPFCAMRAPAIIKKAKQEHYAVYYYFFPLNMHPLSHLLSRLEIAAILKNPKSQANIIDNIYKNERLFNNFQPNQVKQVIKAFNSVSGVGSINIKEIYSNAVTSRLKHDIKMAKKYIVQGTPTLFKDGHNVAKF